MFNVSSQTVCMALNEFTSDTLTKFHCYVAETLLIFAVLIGLLRVSFHH